MRLGLTRWGNSGTGSSVHAQTTLGTLKPVPELQAPRGSETGKFLERRL